MVVVAGEGIVGMGYRGRWWWDLGRCIFAGRVRWRVERIGEYVSTLIGMGDEL